MQTCIHRIQKWWRRMYCKRCKKNFIPPKGWKYKLCLKCEEYYNNYYSNVRLKVLIHYGGNPPKCACSGCNESHVEFLTIDHINGGGRKHRRKVGSGHNFFLWLIRNNFPEGYQVLCMNCNWAKGNYGMCPHNKE